ncbi:hypothetical protein [Streptomyces sp. NPDC007905]|uniref:hypothetical protein n=1 Tax=Streptomyces sp. NPDC007905 TaxID=3364788 RepID=UPI0036EA3EC8
MSAENRHPQHLDTGGGAFVGGNVDTGGGDFVGKDSIKSVVHGSVGRLSVGTTDGAAADGQGEAAFAEFQRALEDLTEQLKLAEMSPGAKKAVIEDVETVLSETQEEEPDADLILHKVDSISQLLGKMAGAATSLTGIADLAHRLLDWATQLFR